jgi:PilZ domain
VAAVGAGNWPGEEKRKHKRVALHADVQCRSGETVLNCRIDNISISGLLIRTADPFPQHEELALRFSMPSGRVIECRARVAHMVPAAFMGVEFIDLPPEAAAVFEQYIAAAPALQGKGRKLASQ